MRLQFGICPLIGQSPVNHACLLTLRKRSSNSSSWKSSIRSRVTVKRCFTKCLAVVGAKTVVFLIMSQLLDPVCVQRKPVKLQWCSQLLAAKLMDRRMLTVQLVVLAASGGDRPSVVSVEPVTSPDRDVLRGSAGRKPVGDRIRLFLSTPRLTSRTNTGL